MGSISGRLALAVVLFFTLFMLIFGGRYHRMETAGGSECDGYVDRVEELRAGSIPRDPYRPLLYTILAAGTGEIIGDSFAARRAPSRHSPLAVSRSSRGVSGAAASSAPPSISRAARVSPAPFQRGGRTTAPPGGPQRTGQAS